MTVPKVFIPVGSNDFESGGITKQLVAGRDPYTVLGKLDTAQASVPAAAGKVDLSGIPVDFLFHGLRIEVDYINAAVALTFLRTSDHGRRYQFRQLRHPPAHPSDQS